METGCWQLHANKRPLIDSGHGSNQTIDRSNDVSSTSSGSSRTDSNCIFLYYFDFKSNRLACYLSDANSRGRSIRGRHHQMPSASSPNPTQQYPLKPVPKLQPPKDTTPYIPPEPTDDETEMFQQGICSGTNFEDYDKIPVNVSQIQTHRKLEQIHDSCFSIQVSGIQCPPPIVNFAEAGLSPFLLQNIRKSGYTRPTPVQKTAIPVILAGRDLMACAQTGSGKTAAFLLPIIESMLARPPQLVIGQPQVVIITPTRELTIQVIFLFYIYGPRYFFMFNVAHIDLQGSPKVRPEQLS